MTSKPDTSWEKYIENCHRFDIKVDPSVVIALKTGWTILQPTKGFNEGAMLPLMDILDKNKTIKKLNLASAGMHDARFRSKGNGNSNARIVNTILTNNTSIEEVDLSYTGLDDDGIEELSPFLKSNKNVTSLNLSNNFFGKLGAERLQAALTVNTSLKRLDVSRNALGFQSINAILCSCTSRGMSVQTNGNYVFEEILNSLSHGLAFLASVIGANILISRAADETSYTDYHFWACVLYSFSLMFLFLSSTLYHSFFMLPQTSRILQVLDHVGIYMLIAGSYTPFLLIALHEHNSARILCAGQWITACIGSIFALCSDLNAPSTTVVEVVIFVCMGYGLIFVWTEVCSTLSDIAFRLLLGGGVAYTVGIIFFALGEFRPVFHVVWHLFVVLAAALHWFDIYFYIAPIKFDRHGLSPHGGADCTVNDNYSTGSFKLW